MTGLFPGECEPVKRRLHQAMKWQVAGFAVYNGLAFLVRGLKGSWQPHLAVNAVVFTALTAYEQHNEASHRARL